MKFLIDGQFEMLIPYPMFVWIEAVIHFSILISTHVSLQLVKLGVNLKNFPSAPAPATFAILFHVGIGAILSLYALFWLKV